MLEQPGDQQVDPAEDATTADEGPGADAEQFANAVDQQAQDSGGTAAQDEPEVPDDASQKMAAAQQHIDNLNMDEQRSQAKKAF